MDELEMQWQELYDAGDTEEDFVDWYSGLLWHDEHCPACQNLCTEVQD